MKTWTTKIQGGEFKVMRLNDAGSSRGALDNPATTIAYLLPKIAESIIYRPDTENMIVINLNARKVPIGFEIISNGTLDTLLVHPRQIFRSAILMNAASIILAHNHPSGDPTPSEADIKVTRDLIRGGQLMKIEIIDHIVIGTTTPERSKGYSSLRELGYFYA